VIKQKKELIADNQQSDNRFFDTAEVKSDLKNKSLFGGAVMMLAQIVRLFMQLAATAILARLLTPADYGLVAMVAAVTGFMVMFQDMGLTMATVQRADINHGQISTLFWINIGFSLCLVFVAVLIAPLIAKFYGEPRLIFITMVLSSSFLFGGLAAQHQALLNRQMRLKIFSQIQIISVAAGYLTGVAFALNGAGYWSLVAIQVVTPMVNAIGVWVASGWVPRLPVRGAGTRQMLKFGMHVSGFSFANYFAQNMDKVLLGRYCGNVDLGLYTKAYQLMMLPMANIKVPLTQVALPALSNLQKDKLAFRAYYLELLRFVAFISMPLAVFMFVCADNIIGVLLGGQWGKAIVIFQVLALFSFIQPVMSTTGIVLVSLGQTKRYLQLGVIRSLVVVVTFCVAVKWGAIGIAVAYAMINYGLILPHLWFSFSKSPLSIKFFIKTISKAAILSIVTGCIVFFMRQKFFLQQTDCISLLSCLVIVLVIYLFLWTLSKSGRLILSSYFQHLCVILRIGSS